MKYVGFWKRFVASIVDSILLATIFNILMWFVLPKSLGNSQIFLFVVTMIFVWLYYALLESSAKQGTLGKIILEMKVVDYNQQRISFVRATSRYFGKIISTVILMGGFVMVVFTSRKQGLHDIIAGTLIVKN